MSNRGRFPKWVTQQIPSGCRAERRDGAFYLYRVVAEDGTHLDSPEPIGIIQEDGIRPIEKRALQFCHIAIYEYGFTRACIELSARKWQSRNTRHWQELLRSIIYTKSKDSYWLRGFQPEESINAKLQAKRFDIFLREEHTSLDELWEMLHDIRLIHYLDSGVEVLTMPTKTQLFFCGWMNIDLGGTE